MSSYATKPSQRARPGNYDVMPLDIDAYLVGYNTERLHQGRSMNGTTPTGVFVRCLP